MAHRHLKGNAGFTLIEILIAMAISGVVLAGIYQAYTRQMRVNNTQNQVVDMQQNVRVAMIFMERDIRMAGLDPSGLADAGIDAAAVNSITVSMDATGGENDLVDNDQDGTIDEADEYFDRNPEQVTYALSNDGNNNGLNDALEGLNTNPCHLMRNGQRLASNIDALNFVYLGIDEGDASCAEDCRLASTATATERANIRSVQVTVIARSGENIPGLSIPHTDDNVYYNHQGDILLNAQVLNDGFRRIRLLSEVRSRNLGLI